MLTTIEQAKHARHMPYAYAKLTLSHNRIWCDIGVALVLACLGSLSWVCWELGRQGMLK